MVTRTTKGKGRSGDGKRASGPVRDRKDADQPRARPGEKGDRGRSTTGVQQSARVARNVVVKREAADPAQARARFAANYLTTTKSAALDAIRGSGRTVLIFAPTYGQALGIAKKQELTSWVHVRGLLDVSTRKPQDVATITILGYHHNERMLEAKKALDQIARAWGVTIPSFDPL